jgi:glutathione S-transferase
MNRMGKPTLYGHPNSPYVRAARMTLHEKGVDYELAVLDFAGLATPEHRRRHPFGKMPAFQHDDLTVFESDAICRYVDEAFPGPRLQPATPAGRARMTQWVSVYNSYCFNPIAKDIFFQRIVGPRFFGRPTDEAVIAAAVPVVEHRLALLDAVLAEDAFLAGDRVSIADLILLPAITLLSLTPEGPKLLPKAPGVTAWKQRMDARQSAKDTMPVW